MDVIIVGATGLVGSVMLKVLEESKLPVENIIPVASASSYGKTLSFKGKTLSVVGFEEALNSEAKVALFSAGGTISLEMAPRFAEKGIKVIDNSSAWRMNPDIQLIVPEINANQIHPRDKIIANPNCSTIQLVMVLAPLHKAFKINRVVVSTYQSVSGTGAKALRQMEAERKGEKTEMAYHYQIDKNCIPHCDVFLDNGYTKEEMKLVNETRKILDDDTIKITATAVRVPVDGGHSESVNITFENDYELIEILDVLHKTPGVIVMDDVEHNIYPMPLFAKGKDDVFVGRIRRDESLPNTLNLWIVADNLRKGAATNAVQIAEYMYHNQLL